MVRRPTLNTVQEEAPTPVMVIRDKNSRHLTPESRSPKDRIPAAAGSASKSTTESFKSPLPPAKTTGKEKTRTLASVVMVVPPTSPSTVGAQLIQEVPRLTDPRAKSPETPRLDLPPTTQGASVSRATEIQTSRPSTSIAGSSTGLSSTSTDKEHNTQPEKIRAKRTQKVLAEPGPWTCRLCTTHPLQTKGGMKRLYKAHYKLWDPYTDLLVDMNEVERAQQELVREMRVSTSRVPSASATGARPVQLDLSRHKSMGPRNEPSSGREIPPRTYTSSSEGSEESRTITIHEELVPSTIQHSEDASSMMTGPTVRIPTKPKRLTTGSRDRRLLIQIPNKPNMPVRSGPLFNHPVDTFDEIEPDVELSDDEVVWLDEEPKTKVKNEFQTFEQVEKGPKLETLKQLLLFGVEATTETARRQIWPAMSVGQEDQLRRMYETMLATVPLVRQLDRTLK